MWPVGSFRSPGQVGVGLTFVRSTGDVVHLGVNLQQLGIHSCMSRGQQCRRPPALGKDCEMGSLAAQGADRSHLGRGRVLSEQASKAGSRMGQTGGRLKTGDRLFTCGLSLQSRLAGRAVFVAC